MNHGSYHLNSKILKHLKNPVPVWCLIILLFLCFRPSGSDAQEYHDYLLKKVGNLYIINVGSNDNVQGFRIYNLFFEEVKRFPLLRFKIKTNKKYFGAVQVTQVFPEYSVVRVVARYLEEEPEGNKIVLVKRELPEQLLKLAYSESGLSLPEDIRKEIEAAPEGETITKQFDIPLKDATYRPFAVGINYFNDYDKISKSVTGSLENTVDTDIYNGSGLFTSDLSSSGGIGINLEKMIHPKFMVRAGLSRISQSSELKSEISPEVELDPGLLAIKKWDFSIKSKVTNWSLSLQYSDFSKALSYFTGDERGRAIVPRYGIGINKATVNVEMDENMIIYSYTGDIEQVQSETDDLGGYWGMHAVIGADYYLQAGKVFFELNYQHWFSDKFDSNIPFRFGGVIFF